MRVGDVAYRVIPYPQPFFRRAKGVELLLPSGRKPGGEALLD
ncbi:MAG: hypothetical protein ANABAC_1793 [Anaerolineae bacterium]|nr:MAG: hypothetical protein ANABAC_1793 [Anaerolineae bacterium]